MQWGMDIVGPLPTTKGNKKFMVVAVDYFTKWAKVEALFKTGQSEMNNFIWKNVIYKYEVPYVLIIDNGTQFEGSIFQHFCLGLNIQHCFSLPGHPQVIGQAKVTNRSILDVMKKRLE